MFVKPYDLLELFRHSSTTTKRKGLMISTKSKKMYL